jgi:hypothetical protein
MKRTFFHPGSKTRRVFRGERGSVLVVVLWVSVSLVSLTLLFGHSMLLAYRATDNDVSARQADQAIEGAVRYAKFLAAETLGELPPIEEYEAEAVPLGEATFWFIGRAADGSAPGSARAYALVDENSKLCLNMGSPAQLPLLAQMLAELPGMTPDLATAIVAWRTSDKMNLLPPANGTATEAKFESVEELALIEGIDELVLYGEDTNQNGALDPNEDDGDRTPPADNADGRLDVGLVEYITAFTKEPATRSDGGTRVNLATGGGQWRTPLQEYLTTALDSTKAQAVLNAIPGGTTRFESVLQFYDLVKGSLSAEDFDKVCSDITAATTELLNVNTASETVLARVPGLGEKAAEALVTQRLTRTQPSTGLAWAAQVIRDNGGNLNEAGKWLTGRSFFVSADVVAVGRHGRGYRRTRCVIDATTSTPRVVYRRNLAPFGWALGSEARQLLAEQRKETFR